MLSCIYTSMIVSIVFQLELREIRTITYHPIQHSISFFLGCTGLIDPTDFCLVMAECTEVLVIRILVMTFFECVHRICKFLQIKLGLGFFIVLIWIDRINLYGVIAVVKTLLEQPHFQISTCSFHKVNVVWTIL